MSDAPGGGGRTIDLGIEGIVDAVPVASGSTATVYRATQLSFSRTVAVKVFRPGLDAQQVAKLDREQQLMGKLSGQTSAVPVFDGGVNAAGLRYLVMPYYRRGSLNEAFADRGPLPWREAVFLMLPVASAVADLHALGVLHRDIKPGNIMLTEHLHPRLADFGISLDLHNDVATPDPASVAFTPSFGAPETFDHVVRSSSVDVYSLGATAWALLAGRSPFLASVDEQDNTVSEIVSRAREGAPGASHVDTPPVVEAVIQQAMSRNPAERQRDGRAFAADLRRAAREAESPDSSPDAQLVMPVPTASRQRGDRTLMVLAAMVLVGCLVLGFVTLF